MVNKRDTHDIHMLPEEVEIPQPLVQHVVGAATISRFHYNGGGTFELPSIPDDHLSIVLDGTNMMECWLSGKYLRGVIHPGDVTLVPHGADSVWMPHQGQSDTLQILIHSSSWESLANATEVNVTTLTLRETLAKPDPLIQHIALALLDEAESPSAFGSLYIQSLQHSLILHLAKHYITSKLDALHEQKSNNTMTFRRSLAFIEEHITHDLSLETLAALEGISPFYFARLFRKAIGHPPHQYIVTRRVERARHLLTSTKLPLAQIAVEVGFANQSHLHRHFVRLLNITPAQYRGQ